MVAPDRAVHFLGEILPECSMQSGILRAGGEDEGHGGRCVGKELGEKVEHFGTRRGALLRLVCGVDSASRPSRVAMMWSAMFTARASHSERGRRGILDVIGVGALPSIISRERREPSPRGPAATQETARGSADACGSQHSPFCARSQK